MAKPRIALVDIMPTLPPHWHPAGCGCRPARPYIRVSKVGKRDKVISPDLQLRAIIEYAKANNLRLLDPICDIDRSGRTFRKRSVDNMITEVKAGKYEVVLLWKWSRWARNVDESAVYLKKVREAGGRVESATEDFDQETAMGRLQKGMTMQFDQYQSDMISEGWRGAHELRRESGLPHNGRRRFGYDYIETQSDTGKKVTKYVPNEEAKILRTAYEKYNEGASLNDIMRLLQASKYKTTLDGEWTAQGAARMLDTGFAAGLIRERSAPSDVPANSILSYDVWRAGSHEPIIDRATWDAYEARRKAQAAIPPRARNAVHDLTGLAFCSECRRRMVTKYAGQGNSHMWICPYKNAFHPGVSVMVNNRLALDATREWVRAVVGGRIDVAGRQAEAEQEMAEEQRLRDAEQVEVKAQITALTNRILNLIDQAELATDQSVRDELNRRMEQRQAERVELERQLIVEPLQPGRQFSEQDRDALRELDEVWDELRAASALRGLLVKLIGRVVVYPRTSESSRKSAEDRVRPAGVWDELSLDDWRDALSA